MFSYFSFSFSDVSFLLVWMRSFVSLYSSFDSALDVVDAVIFVISFISFCKLDIASHIFSFWVWRLSIVTGSGWNMIGSSGSNVRISLRSLFSLLELYDISSCFSLISGSRVLVNSCWPVIAILEVGIWMYIVAQGLVDLPFYYWITILISSYSLDVLLSRSVQSTW